MQSASSSFLPFHVPLIEADDLRAVCEVMESGWITTGPKAAQFEQEFAQYIGTRHAVAVNSGTAALHVALEAIGISEGHEVIVPTLTFAATAEAVVYCRARPVLVDCEPEVFNIDPVQVEHAITQHTRAIIPVHFAGHPCDMEPLLRTARANNLKVIEDAAHALPARYRGRMVGTMGDISCFSFYATKSITTGEGGMATTEEDAWADRMRVMRLHGISKDAWKRYSAEGSWRYEILAPGFKYNLTDMQAALGLSQLAKCNSMWLRRSLLAERYTEALSTLDAFELPTARADVQHAWHLYAIRICPGELSVDRDRVIEELKQRGIGTSVHFIPLHLHPYYRDRWGYRRGDFPVAEDYFDRCISLPLYPAMTDEDQVRVVEALTDIASRYRRPAVAALSALTDGDSQSGATFNALVDISHLSEPPSEPASTIEALPAPGTRVKKSWYMRSGKRLLDIAGAIIGFTFAFPLLALCAVAIRLNSPGPIFFRQRRVGIGGRAFELLKFRTMISGSTGPRITAAGDPRITSIGVLLRRYKLDELPQLINVYRGEMSLVGPRPELAEYVAVYNREQRRVLSCKPGVTSPASLIFIDEEQVLAEQMDRSGYYTRVLLPQKLEIDLAYCRRMSLFVDLEIIARTARQLLPGKRRRKAIPFTPSSVSSRFKTDNQPGSQAA